MITTGKYTITAKMEIEIKDVTIQPNGNPEFDIK